MKSLIKKLVNTDVGILLRNSFNFKPVYYKHYEQKFPRCVSDAFLWRTDNGYRTKFKFSDILKLLYNIDESWVELRFFSKDNQLIKIQKINNLLLSNEFEINSNYLNNIKDYGTFYIFHYSKNINKIKNQDIISNRCYLGYSINNNLHTFVHGNIFAKYANIHHDGKVFTDIVKTSLFKNQTYSIQKYFGDFDKNELFFVNPTNKIIKFSLDQKNYNLKSNNTLQLETTSPIISIKSNCMFFRPTIFSYKGQYMDVHHS